MTAPETKPACRRCGSSEALAISGTYCKYPSQCMLNLHAQLTDAREKLAAWRAAGRSLHFQFPEGHPAIARLVAIGEIEEKQ